LLHSPKSALAAAPHGLHGGPRGLLLIRACRFPRWPGVGRNRFRDICLGAS
jgi:hypothetical protein